MDTTQQQFRRLMGRFVTGITVIAFRSSQGEVAAMTANAVTAVSLDPIMLLCCIRNESRLLKDLVSTGRFSINVLNSGQGDISSHYGGRRQEESPATWLNTTDVPILSGANASFICEVSSTCPAGDHTVIFGAVEEMSAVEVPAPALVFAAGRYQDLVLAAH